MNNKGFTLSEVLIAFSLILIVIATVIPISSLLKSEQKILKDRRAIVFLLHDELQPYLWNSTTDLPITYIKTINNNKIHVHFNHVSENTIKGCAVWENAKQKEERFCVHGYPEK
ncbi:prepilin-type N-terminal cleavage/methylation domain-containing protein [Virgibacillus sp. W0430]|uniref:prepilin-type N-terminal cleavage/methylation domain-containing protein n=1 Tax=Virgibacillus sp. W0430 TaxID=3391580 RepID=UPI003F45063A